MARFRAGSWRGSATPALDAARAWAGHFPDGDFAIELSHHRGPDDDWLVAQLAALADDAGLPTVVTNEVHYAEAGGHRLQDVLVCIRHGATLDEARELLLPNAEYRVKPGASWRPSAQDCRTHAPAAPGQRGSRAQAPSAPNAGWRWISSAIGFRASRSPRARRRSHTSTSLRTRAYGPLSAHYQACPEAAGARAGDHRPHQPGRVLPDRVGPDGVRAGATSSARGGGVPATRSWPTALGITKVDPIAHKLLFERFINEARDPPRHRHRLRRQPSRGGDPVPLQPVWRRPLRHGLHRDHLSGPIRGARGGQGARLPARGGRPVAKALDTRDASDVARDLALDGGFAWLFEELGVPMDVLAVPPGRDGRGQTDGAASRPGVVPAPGQAAARSVEPGPSVHDFVRPSSDSSWNHRPRPTLRPDLAAAEAHAREVSGDHDGRSYSEGGWYPPRRPNVLVTSVTHVRHESWERQRYGPAPAPSPPRWTCQIPATTARRDPGTTRRTSRPRWGGAYRPGERHADPGAASPAGHPVYYSWAYKRPDCADSCSPDHSEWYERPRSTRTCRSYAWEW